MVVFNKWLWLVGFSLCVHLDQSTTTVGGFAFDSPDAKVSGNLSLLEFVVQNDDDWLLVFNQKIKLTYENLPPYHGIDVDNDTKTKLRLLDEGVIEIAPLSLIQKVLKDFAWLGSYVEYASYVLHTAFMCTTFELVLLQMDLVLMLDKLYVGVEGEIDDDTRALTDEAWLTLAVFMDKLTAVKSGVDMMADLSYQYTKVAVVKRKDQVYVLGLMKKEIESIVDGQCYRMETSEIHGHFGIRDDFEKLNGTEPTKDMIVDTFNRASVGIMEMYNGLNVKTMAFENWEQILDFQIPIKKNINLYLKIEKLLVNDTLGEKMLNDQREKVKSIMEDLK